MCDLPMTRWFDAAFASGADIDGSCIQDNADEAVLTLRGRGPAQMDAGESLPLHARDMALARNPPDGNVAMDAAP